METPTPEFTFQPKNPEQSLKQRKEVLWQKIVSELSQTGDRLGIGKAFD